MKRFLLLLVLAATAALAADVSSFNGTWVLAKAEANGDDLDLGVIPIDDLVLKDGAYTLNGRDSVAKGKYTLDTTRTPWAMDSEETEGQNPGVVIKAIAELTADGWRACYNLAGGDRPTEFKTVQDSGFLLASYKRKPGTEPAVKPLRVLMISGGCCHDYPGQDKILSEGIKARANVDFTVVRDPGQTGVKHKISVYQQEGWAKGYDLVIHNECFSDEKELEWLERIVKPHREGVPAVVIHCAMHCYRAPTNEWFKFVGVTSHGHGSHFAYPMTNVKPEHPVMKGFPPLWQTPREELYNIASMEKTATPLATGFSPETKRGEVNVWVNTYNGTRVFGTTLGHYNHTMSDPVFLDLVARGSLWAAGKLADDGRPAAGYGPAR